MQMCVMELLLFPDEVSKTDALVCFVYIYIILFHRDQLDCVKLLQPGE